MPVSAPLTIALVRTGTATLEQLKAAVPAHKDIVVNSSFASGDHWQGGDGWVGPQPGVGDPTRGDIMALVEKGFSSRNVVDEVMDRLVSAILGKEPRWYWAPVRPMSEDEEPTAEEATRIAEVNAAVTQWWDLRKVHKALKRQLYRMLYGQRCVGRLYFPPLAPGATVRATTLAEALTKVFLDIPLPENGGVWEDPDTKDRVGIVLYQDENNQDRAEVSFLDEAGQTVTQTYPGGVKVTNNFGGALPIYEMSADEPMITEQLRSLNRQLNMTLTLLSKGLIDSHFLERLIMNAMPPGHWEYEDLPDETGKRIRKAYVPDKHITGGRMTTYLQGTDYEDEQGRTQIKDPSVVFRAPTDPTNTTKGSDYWYGMMLDEARQAHVLVNQASAVGWKSREQARGDFVDSTNDPQSEAETGGRELLIALVHIGEAVCGKVGFWTKTLKPVLKCRPQYGVLTPEERAQNVAEAEAGYMADETAMALNGIDDTSAELALIAGQPRAALKLSLEQATAVKAWMDAGFTMTVALGMIGMNEPEIAAIMKRNAETPDTDPEEEDVDDDEDV